MLTNEQIIKVIRADQQGIIESDKRIAELEKVKVTGNTSHFKLYRQYNFLTGGKLDIAYINIELDLQIQIKSCLERHLLEYKNLLKIRKEACDG